MSSLGGSGMLQHQQDVAAVDLHSYMQHILHFSPYIYVQDVFCLPVEPLTLHQKKRQFAEGKCLLIIS